MPSPHRPDSSGAAAIARYEAVRHRLPATTFPTGSLAVGSLRDLIAEFDLFILDAFGVINVGEQAIEGAADSVNALSRAGKQVVVLTNGSSARALDAHAKYLKLGFELDPWQVISSRDICAMAFRDRSPDERWAVIDRRVPALGEFPVRVTLVGDDASAWEDADGIVFLSSGAWTDVHQQRLIDALQRRKRPLWVGNPDLVAPREHGFSLQAGHFAHDVADAVGLEPRFFGKPFGNAFDAVFERLREQGVARPSAERTVMVGDSPHTDILGGAAAGVRTVLITGHGLLRGMDVMQTLDDTGITPDFIAPTT